MLRLALSDALNVRNIPFLEVSRLCSQRAGRSGSGSLRLRSVRVGLAYFSPKLLLELTGAVRFSEDIIAAFRLELRANTAGEKPFCYELKCLG
jgi:hypothetical protein